MTKNDGSLKVRGKTQFIAQLVSEDESSVASTGSGRRVMWKASSQEGHLCSPGDSCAHTVEIELGPHEQSPSHRSHTPGSFLLLHLLRVIASFRQMLSKAYSLNYPNSFILSQSSCQSGWVLDNKLQLELVPDVVTPDLAQSPRQSQLCRVEAPEAGKYHLRGADFRQFPIFWGWSMLSLYCSDSLITHGVPFEKSLQLLPGNFSKTTLSSIFLFST